MSAGNMDWKFKLEAALMASRKLTKDELEEALKCALAERNAMHAERNAMHADLLGITAERDRLAVQVMERSIWLCKIVGVFITCDAKNLANTIEEYMEKHVKFVNVESKSPESVH